jgi:hypothetical protein
MVSLQKAVNLLGTKKERLWEEEIGALMLCDPHKLMLEDLESFIA